MLGGYFLPRESLSLQCAVVALSTAWLGAKKRGVDGQLRQWPYHRRMSKLLLNLRNVPDDELDDVRAMLDEHRIGFYETQPSRWGISYGGVWVTDDKDIAQAKRLMADYQSRRQARVRAEYSKAREEGSAETFMDVVREQPLRVLLTVVAVVVLLGLVALPAYLLRQ